MDLMDRCDALMAAHNPCQREGGRCLAGDPIPCCQWTPWRRDDGSAWCAHLGPAGCGYPNLGCKAWYCRTALEVMPADVRDAVWALEAEAKATGALVAPFLGDRYIGDDQF